MEFFEQRVGAPCVPERRAAEIEHADQQALLQPWIPMDCIQLSNSPRVGVIDSLSMDGQHIVRELQGAAVQKLGNTPKGVCTLSYCTVDPRFRFSELGSDQTDTIYFMSGGTEFDIFAPAGVETTYLCLDEDMFLAAVRAIDPAQWTTPPIGLHQFTIAQKSAIRALIDLQFTFSTAARWSRKDLPSAAMHQAIQQIALAVARGLREVPPTRPERSPHGRVVGICHAARDFVEARLDDDLPPGIAEVCVAVGVSERTLQYAFQDYISMSPLAYFRQLRLNRVRTVLKNSMPEDTTVTNVAMQFGFLHLSRFAQDYRRAFDEAPSMTLAAAGKKK